MATRHNNFGEAAHTLVRSPAHDPVMVREDDSYVVTSRHNVETWGDEIIIDREGLENLTDEPIENITASEWAGCEKLIEDQEIMQLADAAGLQTADQCDACGGTVGDCECEAIGDDIHYS